MSDTAQANAEQLKCHDHQLSTVLCSGNNTQIPISAQCTGVSCVQRKSFPSLSCLMSEFLQNTQNQWRFFDFKTSAKQHEICFGSLAAGSCLCPDVGGNMLFVTGLAPWTKLQRVLPKSSCFEVRKVRLFHSSAFLSWGLYGPCVYLCSPKMMVLTSHLHFVGMKNTRAQQAITVII